MVLVGIDDSSIQADSQPKLFKNVNS